MNVRGTRKRIEALEGALPPSAQPDGLDDETVRAALELVSMEDLRALRSLAELDRKCDGTVGREPDAREMQAQGAFARALTQVQTFRRESHLGSPDCGTGSRR
jgi:hypothetical protein